MNKELNLVEILKNVPSGTKFWSDIEGEITFSRVSDDSEYPIITFNNNYTKNGCYYLGKGQCVLFPSKDQRDWSKFIVEEVFEKDEPVMCSDDYISWYLRYFNLSFKRPNSCGYKSDESIGMQDWNCVVKVSDFDFVNRCKKTK